MYTSVSSCVLSSKDFIAVRVDFLSKKPVLMGLNLDTKVLTYYM